MTLTARCFHCKRDVQPKGASVVRTRNGRHRLTGKCPACGRKVSRFVRSGTR